MSHIKNIEDATNAPSISIRRRHFVKVFTFPFFKPLHSPPYRWLTMKGKAIYEKGSHDGFCAIHIHTWPMFVVGELMKGVEISSSPTHFICEHYIGVHPCQNCKSRYFLYCVVDTLWYLTHSSPWQANLRFYVKYA